MTAVPVQSCQAPEPAFSCPVCRMTSHHPEDIARGYCGNCHDYTRALVSFATTLRDLGVAGWRDLPMGGPGSRLANALADMTEQVDRAAVAMARAVGQLLLAAETDEMSWTPGMPEW